MKAFFKTITQSLNPNSYEHLVTRKTKDAFHYMISVLAVCLLLLSLLHLPDIGRIDKGILELASVDLEISMDSPVLISDNPAIVVDTRSAYDGDQKILIDENGIFLIPSDLTSRAVLGERARIASFDEKGLAFLLRLLLILLLPTIGLAIFAGYLMKYILCITLTCLVASAVIRAKGKGIGFNYLLRAGLYASGSMIIADTLVEHFIELYFIPYMLFVSYLVIAIVLNYEDLEVQR